MDNITVKIIDCGNNLLYFDKLDSLNKEEFKDKKLGVIEVIETSTQKNIELKETIMVIYNNDEFKFEEFKGLKTPYKFVSNAKATYDYSLAHYIHGSSSDKMINILETLSSKEKTLKK